MTTFTHKFSFGTESVDVSIDFNTLPQAAKDFIINYGIRQYLSDGAAVAKDEAETEEARNEIKRDRVQERVQKLEDGTMSIRGGTRTTDPVALIKREIATATLKPIFKQHGKAWPKGAELTAVVDKFWANNGDKPKYKTELEERVAKLAEITKAEEINVEGLL